MRGLLVVFPIGPFLSFRFFFSNYQSPPLSKTMEEAHSVNSPRRVLSFSKRQKQKPFGLQDSDSTRSSPFRASQVQGPKPSEVYGFVGSISTVVATLIFLIWAYVPDKLLESIGIHYYPSRYWVLAMPTYLMVTLLLGLAFYIGLNFIATPHPTSLNTLFGECLSLSSGIVLCVHGVFFPSLACNDDLIVCLIYNNGR